MKPVLTRCGYRCDLCLAHNSNVLKNPSNQQKRRDGWFKYYGFRVPPTEICCDSCLEENPRLIDQSCPVRPCSIDNGMNNCLQCG